MTLKGSDFLKNKVLVTQSYKEPWKAEILVESKGNMKWMMKWKSYKQKLQFHGQLQKQSVQ